MPTTVTDPAGNSSTVIYRHDIGANVRAQSPAPNGQPQGKITTREYDPIGRLSIDKIVNHGGVYTRYEYPTNGIQSKVFSTIIDTNANGADTADEVLSESWTDGAGRVRRSRTEHPGSIGGYSGSLVEYDILGRATRQSVPTEIDNSWNPAGDDATRGFLWTYQKYDWMSRVVRKINTDGIDSPTINDSDVLISYAGCGCAGGLETTIQSESVPRDDQPGTYGRRTQKVYDDILGRTWKTVVTKWDGTTPYTTTEQQFNGRDQVLQSTRIDNTSTTSPQASQVVTMSYDGHGRLATQHLPQQDANANTSFAYNADDSVSVKTDGRGATATMTYNERGIVTQIVNVLPVATPTPTPSPTPTPPPTTTSYYSPIGFLDGVNDSNASVLGWSLDPDNPYASNVIHFYIGGPAGSGTYVGQTTADRPRPDVNTNTGHPGNHGFQFSIPEQYLNGQYHSIYAYGLDTGANQPTLLTDSPKVFNLLPPILPPPTITTTNFAYDSVGNRTSMTDHVGSTMYEYDELSRMTSETRQFADTLTHAPLPNNSFKLTYTYHLAGALKSLTDPYNDVINYANDKTGRLDAVTGSTFGGVTNYASNPGYRAWGGLKGLSYGNGVQMNMTFDNRLLPDYYELKKNTTDILKKNYEYNQDGALKYTEDLLAAKFDRLNIYDHVGRIKEGKSGAEARGGTVPPEDMDEQLPYRQNYQFNAFDNMTQRNNLHWGIDNWHGQSNNLNYTYQNDRITNPNWQYDADGRVTVSSAPEDYSHITYDARGLISRTAGAWSHGSTDIERFYNGDGREVKRKKRTFIEDPERTTWPFGGWVEDDTIYYIRSTVLGGEVVSETYPLGQKKKTFVMAAGAKIATQSAYLWNGSSNKSVSFEHADASGMSYRTTTATGTAVTHEGQYEGAPAEIDPMGGNMGTSTPYFEEPIPVPPPQPEYSFFPIDTDYPMFVNGQRVFCSLDGMSIGCGAARGMLETGSAIPAALAQYQNMPGFNFQSHGLGIFTATITQFAGYSLGFANGNSSDWLTMDLGSALSQIEGGETLIRNWLVTDMTFVFSATVTWAPQRQTPQSNKPHSGKKDLKAFFKANPNCKKALKKLGFNIGRLFKNAEFTDLTSDSSDLGKTYRELGANGDDVSLHTLDYRNFEDDGKKIAEVIPGTNKVYLFSRFYQKDAAGRGSVIVHELLHTAKGSHVTIAKSLGMNIDHDFRDINMLLSPSKFDTRTGTFTDSVWMSTKVDVNEGVASEMLDNWLNNNCPSQTK